MSSLLKFLLIGLLAAGLVLPLLPSLWLGIIGVPHQGLFSWQNPMGAVLLCIVCGLPPFAVLAVVAFYQLKNPYQERAIRGRRIIGVLGAFTLTFIFGLWYFIPPDPSEGVRLLPVLFSKYSPFLLTGGYFLGWFGALIFQKMGVAPAVGEMNEK